MATISLTGIPLATIPELAAALMDGASVTPPPGATDEQIIAFRTKQILTGILRRYKGRQAGDPARAAAEAAVPDL
jgi:hypothetical protein